MVSGVARVQVYGEQKYAVRVQVDPDKLAAHNIGIDEVQAAIASSNTNLPTGRLDGAKQAFTIESSGGLLNAAAYRPIIVSWRNGAPVRLDDVANVVDGVEDDKLIAWYNDTNARASWPSTASPAPTPWTWWTTSSSLLPEFRTRDPRRGAALAWPSTLRNPFAIPFTTWSSPSC